MMKDAVQIKGKLSINQQSRLNVSFMTTFTKLETHLRLPPTHQVSRVQAQSQVGWTLSLEGLCALEILL